MNLLVVQEINNLKEALDLEKAHRESFEKVRDVLQQEILRLRNENRELRERAAKVLCASASFHGTGTSAIDDELIPGRETCKQT